jgi:hypothetical protein
MGVKVYLQAFLISELDAGEWLASRLGRFALGKRGPGILYIGDWVGPRASLDIVEKRKITAATRNQTPIPWSSSPLPSLYTNWAMQAAP